MKKMMFALVLALAVSVCGAALAEQGVAYGVYIIRAASSRTASFA